MEEELKGPRPLVVKVADLGNACWIHKHFTDDVTTREYRSPEVIVGCPYGPAIDVWSVACLVFELITGDYLFKPKEDPNGQHSRDEDHLALMQELLGKMPKRLRTQGKHSNKYYSRRGELRHIQNLESWPLHDVLSEKYAMTMTEAKELSSFLEPMLNLEPNSRATAQQMLQHPWLHVDPNKLKQYTTNLFDQSENFGKEDEEEEELEEELEKEKEKEEEEELHHHPNENHETDEEEGGEDLESSIHEEDEEDQMNNHVYLHEQEQE